MSPDVNDLNLDAEAERLRAALAAGDLTLAGVELAAWLGYAPARPPLGDAAPPCGCLDWIYSQLLPSMTGHALADSGRLPDLGRDNAWPSDQAARAVLAWARAALPSLEAQTEAQGEASKRVEAAQRYLLDRSPENDIPLGLMFGDAPTKHPAYELAQYACRLAADPSKSDVPSLLREATQRAAKQFASNPDVAWPRRKLARAVEVLRRALVPWAVGRGDPLREGPQLGARLRSQDALWIRPSRADWARLVDV